MTHRKLLPWLRTAFKKGNEIDFSYHTESNLDNVLNLCLNSTLALYNTSKVHFCFWVRDILNKYFQYPLWLSSTLNSHQVLSCIPEYTVPKSANFMRDQCLLRYEVTVGRVTHGEGCHIKNCLFPSLIYQHSKLS